MKIIQLLQIILLLTLIVTIVHSQEKEREPEQASDVGSNAPTGQMQELQGITSTPTLISTSNGSEEANARSSDNTEIPMDGSGEIATDGGDSDYGTPSDADIAPVEGNSTVEGTTDDMFTGDDNSTMSNTSTWSGSITNEPKSIETDGNSTESDGDSTESDGDSTESDGDVEMIGNSTDTSNSTDMANDESDETGDAVVDDTGTGGSTRPTEIPVVFWGGDNMATQAPTAQETSSESSPPTVAPTVSPTNSSLFGTSSPTVDGTAYPTTAQFDTQAPTSSAYSTSLFGAFLSSSIAIVILYV